MVNSLEDLKKKLYSKINYNYPNKIFTNKPKTIGLNNNEIIETTLEQKLQNLNRLSSSSNNYYKDY